LLASGARAAITAAAVVTAHATITVGRAGAGAVDVTHHAVGAHAARATAAIVAACAAVARRLAGDVKALAGRQEALVVAGTRTAAVGAAVVATDASITIRRARLVRELVEILREGGAITCKQRLTRRHRPGLHCTLQDRVGKTSAVRVDIEVDAVGRAGTLCAVQRRRMAAEA